MTMRLRHVRWLAVLGITALLLAVGLPTTHTSMAANLTGGTYTYVVKGKEVSFLFDPVKIKEELLLPSEVFEHFGIKVEGDPSGEIGLRREGVTVLIALGSAIADVNGREEPIRVGPLRLNDRFFLPAGLLWFFGIEFTHDGFFLLMREYADPRLSVQQLSQEEYAALLSGRHLVTTVRSDTNTILNAEFVLLNAELLRAANLGLNYETRAQLYDRLASNTLMFVTISNPFIKAGSLMTTDLFLVDDQRHQYEAVDMIDIGQGRLDGRLAPMADRTGVLLFPKLAPEAARASLYYDPNAGIVGSFTDLP